MQRGLSPTVLFDKDGEIFAISTGSDATSEHEQGSKRLQSTFCRPHGARPAPGFVRQVAEACGVVDRPPLSDAELISALRAGKPVRYPPLLERKAISQNLDRLHFVMGEEGGESVAVFGHSPRGVDDLVANQPKLRLYGAEQCAGAWDEGSFAIKVRGQEYVLKLERFAEKVKQGDGLFAGTFLERSGDKHLSGVIIALRSGMGPQHLQDIAKAQAEWEASLRLEARSRAYLLLDMCRSAAGARHIRMPGHVWPVWLDGPDSEVAYALNPNDDRNGPYYGPYTFEALKAWILAEEKVRLTPIAR